MSHEQRYPTGRAVGSGRLPWRRLAPGFAVALLLSGASALSLIHLVQAWRDAAPLRAARAAAAAAERLRLEAERAPPIAVEPPRQAEPAASPVSEPVAPPPVPVPDPVRTPPARLEQPVRWITPPVYAVRDRDLAPGLTRATVRFTCDVGPDGRLSACRSEETPAGSGLAAAARPALLEARMEPLRDGGRPVEGVVTLTLGWERRTPDAVQRTPPDPASQPAPAPAEIPSTPATPATEVVETPPG